MEQKQKRWGLLGLAVVVLLTVTVIGVITPWAFHIGGRFTPLYWSGTGTLVCTNGSYSVYVLFYLARGGDTLHGWGSLCTSRNKIVPLDLHGEVRNAYWNLDRASMEMSLSEPLTVRETILNGHGGGGIQLVGHWEGPELVLKDEGYMPTTFRSGFKFEQPSLTLSAGRKSDFQSACSTTDNVMKSR